MMITRSPRAAGTVRPRSPNLAGGPQPTGYVDHGGSPSARDPCPVWDPSAMGGSPFPGAHPFASHPDSSG